MAGVNYVDGWVRSSPCDWIFPNRMHADVSQDGGARGIATVDAVNGAREERRGACGEGRFKREDGG